MPSQGSIITRVYTSDAYIPLQNVPVLYIRTDENGNAQLLRVLFTDSSGLTEPYFIETPSVAQSLSPGNARPFSLIDIMVSYPGYNAVIAEGIQIFPDVQTIQGIQLRPVPPQNHGEDQIILENQQNL